MTTQAAHHDATWAALAAALCGAWYALLITGFSLDLLAPVPRGLTFNAMLLHLLDGRVDVDPGVLVGEGFVRDGRSYAYFGVVPALLRLPMLLVPGGIGQDVTTLGTWLAAVLACYWQLRTVQVVHTHLMRPLLPCCAARALVPWLALVLALGGPQVQFLRASIYQESIGWAASFAALFMLACARGMLAPAGFSSPVLRQMALAAGLALATRVTIGVGLYAALGGLLAVLAWPGRVAPIAWLRALLAPRLLVPALVLAVFLGWTLLLNQLRWGDPFTVADLGLQTFTHLYPGRLERVQAGMFSPARLWVGVIYYFAPGWVLYLPGGGLLLAPFYAHLAELELPPASFLLSDPLLLVLGGVGLAGALREARLRHWLLVLGPPLMIAPVLMLGLVFMNHRYRLEFYPLLTLLALFGMMVAARSGRTLRWAPALATLSVLGAHAQWYLYTQSRFGPGTQPAVQALLANLGL